MKLFFTWLIAFGVLVGFGNRVHAFDSCFDQMEVHASGHDHHHHEHDSDHPCDADHDQQCPMDHHHSHGSCGHSMPMGVDASSTVKTCNMSFSLCLMSSEEEQAPDEPVAELDKPPLI